MHVPKSRLVIILNSKLDVSLETRLVFALNRPFEVSEYVPLSQNKYCDQFVLYFGKLGSN